MQALRAAEAAGVPFTLSTVGLCSIEEVAQAATKPFWFQLYVMRDRGFVAELIERAKAARCGALVLTVDLAVPGSRYRDVRSGMMGGVGAAGKLALAWDTVRHAGWVYDVALRGRPLVFGTIAPKLPGARSLPEFVDFVGRNFDASVTWKDVEWIRSLWGGPLIVKGVLDPDDARAAAESGAHAVVVSNHGGRQLDSVPSTISALPAIVDAVGGRVEVLFDGGVRSGLDVFKALAFGARAALLGRAWVFPLAALGEAGVTRVLGTVRRELEVALALAGVTSVSGISREQLVDAGNGCRGPRCGIGLPEWPVSESGRLSHGDGGHEWGGRCRRAFMLTSLWCCGGRNGCCRNRSAVSPTPAAPGSSARNSGPAAPTGPPSRSARRSAPRPRDVSAGTCGPPSRARAVDAGDQPTAALVFSAAAPLDRPRPRFPL